MKIRFTIGQMSKLHHISVKTLRYYDEIDLFKPIEVDPESGYRYYSLEQFKQLDSISYLKTLGVSLKEIKQQINENNVAGFLEMLTYHREMTEKKIQELEHIQHRFTARIKEIESATKEVEIGVPTVERMGARAIVQIFEKITSLYELELSLRKLNTEFNGASPIIVGKVGFTLSLEQIKVGHFSEYNSIFILLEELNEQKKCFEGVSYFPAGDYLSVYYRARRNEVYPCYEDLLEHIETSGYEIKGDFIVRAIIDQFITTDPQEYLTQIQVPLK